MSLRLDPATRAAAGLISALHQVCFPEDPWDIATVSQIVEMAGFFGRVGRLDGEAAGFGLAHNLGGEVEILSLGVVPAHRRAGMGSAILDSICSEAQRRGAECVLLEVAVDNYGARALYAARGFTIVGRRPHYYRQAARPIDALILRVTLATTSVAT
jgi:ribosomal-protein-alanine N-acetyltransferase